MLENKIRATGCMPFVGHTCTSNQRNNESDLTTVWRLRPIYLYLNLIDPLFAFENLEQKIVALAFKYTYKKVSLI